MSLSRASQKPENGASSQGKEVKQAFGKGISHLNALIDAVHYPVKEAVVNILSQGVPSILSLGWGARSH